MSPSSSRNCAACSIRAAGYFKKGGRFVPSLVAEIGDVVEEHLKSIGLLKDEVPDQSTTEYLEEKRQHHVDGAEAESEFPQSAEICNKCMTKAVIYQGRMHDVSRLRRLEVRVASGRRLPRGSAR